MLMNTTRRLALRRSVSLLGYKPTKDQIQDLRYRTEAPIGDCMKALVASDGDLEKAMAWLKEKGKSRAQKKHGRVTDEGMLAACCGPHGAMVVQICCETDFSGRNERFIELCNTIKTGANTLIDASEGKLLQATSDEIVAELAAKSKEEIAQTISKVGENITIKRAIVLPPAPEAVIADTSKPYVKTIYGSYSHNSLFGHSDVGTIVGLVGLRIANDGSTLLQAGEGAAEICDLAQHIVANLANSQGLSHQAFLGSDETTGQWMKKRQASLSSGLAIKFGEEPVIHFPQQGRPQNPKK